ncbi:MAG TPA: hypothetical protein PKD55_02195 [Bellilinea sp.]|nr:hypothetical protein [Bellilinea sp.]
MPQYLIVAEVDKIQSFIFRSSRLREVAGASQLLEDFCSSIKETYGSRVLASKGGSFRIMADEAVTNGVVEDLRRQFDKEIGGSITITRVPYQPEHNVIKRGNSALRHAKLEGEKLAPIWHSPYLAICASSGEELAVAYEHPGGYENGQPRFPNERPRYIGQTTRKKGEENAVFRLLDAFIERMQSITEHENIEKLDDTTEADTYAQFDPRHYVAYMVSDGNSMGAVFNACSPDQLRELSDKIGEITSDALIQAVEGICAETYSVGQVKFPVLPLISGGDDLFALMPAPWAMDVATRFCKEYQQGMTTQLRSMKLLDEHENATTGAAAVICKASYPYRIAYQHAHELLEKAKRRAKQVKQSCLIVDFVVGSDTIATGRHIEPHPYTFEEASYFMKHRYVLRALPSRIRHQIEAVLIGKQDISRIVERVEQLNPDLEYAHNLQQAYDEAQAIEGDRLHELLKLWDFCYSLSRRREAYLTEEH